MSSQPSLLLWGPAARQSHGHLESGGCTRSPLSRGGRTLASALPPGRGVPPRLMRAKNRLPRGPLKVLAGLRGLRGCGD